MKNTDIKPNYVEWLSAEVMHEASRKWLSELRFIEDEQLFFDDLIKSYTLQFIDSRHFEEGKKIVDRLKQLEKESSSLIETVSKHENDLEIMVNGIEEPEKEDAYRNEHRELIIEESKFIKGYRVFKTQLFVLVKSIIREQKQKRLLQ